MTNPHTDIHADLAASVRAYAEREGALARVRTLRDSPSGLDRPCWTKVAALGWLGLRVSEALGGAGLGVAESSVLARELGRTLVPEPVTAVAVLAARILIQGRGEASRTLLERLVAGSVFPAVAWQERLDTLDPSSVAARLTAVNGGGELCGSKQCVAFGAEADGYIVSARTPLGIGLYWVERQHARITYRAMRRADGSEHGMLQLDHVGVRPDHCLVAPGEGDGALAAALDETLIAISAELLGLGERALEITLEYLRTRVQFGKPIGSYQALQHRCVDLFIAKELGLCALTAALSQWDRADPARRSALASRVKARCADAALDICRKSIQMHGAMGFTDQCDIGLYLKRALVLAAWLGNARSHRRRYARLTCLASSAGAMAEGAA